MTGSRKYKFEESEVFSDLRKNKSAGVDMAEIGATAAQNVTLNM